jgi:hypothetical protein
LGSFVEGRRRGASTRPFPFGRHPRESPTRTEPIPAVARRLRPLDAPVAASTPRSPHWWIPRVAPFSSSWIPAIWPTFDALTGSRSLPATGWWPTKATIPPLSVTGSGMQGAVPASPTSRTAKTRPAGTEASTCSATAWRTSSNASNASAASAHAKRSFPSTSSPSSNPPPSSIRSSPQCEDAP